MLNFAMLTRISPVAGYFLITLIISWGYWGLMVTRGAIVQPGSIGTHLPGLLGPAIAGVVMCLSTRGVDGLRDLLMRITSRHAWRLQGIGWGLLLIPVVAGLYASGALLGVPLPTPAALFKYPGVQATSPWYATTLVVFLVSGMAEEIGWRGFLTDHLLLRNGPARTSFLVGVLTLVWHLPLFYLVRSMAGLADADVVGWALGIVFSSFVLTQIYLRSQKSLVATAIWHGLFNLFVQSEAGAGIWGRAITTYILFWGGGLAWIWWRQSGTCLLSARAYPDLEGN